MQIIQLLFLISFAFVWLVDPPKVAIAVGFTIAFGLVWLCAAMIQYLNGPPPPK